MTQAAGARERAASPWKRILASVSTEEPAALHWNRGVQPDLRAWNCGVRTDTDLRAGAERQQPERRTRTLSVSGQVLLRLTGRGARQRRPSISPWIVSLWELQRVSGISTCGERRMEIVFDVRSNPFGQQGVTTLKEMLLGSEVNVQETVGPALLMEMGMVL
ncbi:hypothetical protein EYF80_038290 [Liparis tanakae]|uniref:Uncharacterized protein n=1 Tax=Liparis tanakae TaxID=230148 RepID=A0A4Z2GD74_9TELE|nr:hypothetical protein EYF80_038290 [Liparis tanakae]